MTTSIPDSEDARVRALHALEILDTPPEQQYEDVARLAAQICGTPIALVTMLDAKRQWFKARVGFDLPETPRDIAFCAHTVHDRDLMIVRDALADPRFRENPLVTDEPKIRFYAGVPLVLKGGDAVGTLCVIDRVPRDLTPQQELALRILGREVTTQLELRRMLREQELSARAIAENSRALAEQATLLDLAHDAILVRDEQNRIVFWNRGAAALYGWTAAEATGWIADALLRTRFLTPLESIERALLETGVWEGDLVHHARGGREIVVSSRWARLRDSSATKRILEMNRDITDRVRVEAELRELTERLHALVFERTEELRAANSDLAREVADRKRAEHELKQVVEREIASRAQADRHSAQLVTILERITDGFVALDNDFRYSYVNERGAAMLGRTADQLIGKHIWTEFPEGVGQPFHAAYQRAIREQRPIQIEEYYEPWDRWFENRIYPSPDGITIFFQEITDRKRAERLLAESEQRYRMLFENANDGFLVFELADAPIPPILDANAAACRITGYEREELLRLTPLDLEPPEHAAGRGAAIKTLRQEGRLLIERTLLRKDGSRVPVELSAHRFELRGRQIVLAIVRDISDRKRTEAELRALSARVLDAQESERKRIAREVHDDLGQKLTALRLGIGASRSADASLARERADDMLGLVDETIETVRRIASDLRPSMLDDLGLAAALENEIQKFENRVGIPCDLSIEPEDLSPDASRSTTIFRIVQEALTNVARHSGATEAEVRIRVRDGEVLIEVRDNGRGASPDRLTSGDSLGLIGMRERATLVGGTVEIASVPDRGTIVNVSIPLGERSP